MLRKKAHQGYAGQVDPVPRTDFIAVRHENLLACSNGLQCTNALDDAKPRVKARVVLQGGDDYVQQDATAARQQHQQAGPTSALGASKLWLALCPRVAQ